MLRKIASFGMAIVLTATLLWGGCISCAQYFMFPSISAKTCCMPSGHCKDKPSKPSSQEECRIQSLAFAKAPVVPEQAAIPVSSFAVLPAQTPTSRVALRLDARGDTYPANQASPPGLYLLHSVFLI